VAEESGHILVADDNPVSRKLISRALEEQGHTVVTAEHGAQALEIIRSQPFDLVLLDILMPERDGYEVLESLKADPDLRHLPVIMISAVDELDSVIRCIEMGATDYLPKPFNAALLRARINASLITKRMHDMEQAHLSEVQAYLVQIEAEQEKSERLLLNILPESIAERLKESEAIIADSFPDVTVLFADLVGFTRLSSQIAPGELVLLLDEIFSEFDDLAETYRLEKIKTIGDAYMAVSGLPEPSDHHVEAAANMALDMRAAVTRVGNSLGRSLQARIGLHTGPVVAGVIGRKKFIYDLWGDTVNTASRMESHGISNQIHITTEVFQRLGNHYEFQELGSTEIKGKGAMETYLLVGRKLDE
jgi:class 3 adenylate cyclase